MGNWKTCTIADLGMVVGGATPSTKEAENYDGGTIAWITPKDLAGYSERFISHGERDITETGLHSCSAQMMPRHSVLFSSRAPIGYVAIAENELCTNQGFKSVVPNENTDYMFLYYLLLNNRQRIEHMGSGTTFKEVSGKTMRSIEVRVPESKEEQIRISSILSTIDDKIEENERINKNLFAQVMALYKHFFTESVAEHISCRADEYFDITIGKTPPRKEREWFSTNQKDECWVSISDMGNCGLYISNTSERLTHDAIRRFNIVIVPDNTVLLSFKLTVGRLAITDGEMVTNEAIAHFKTDKAYINPYLFCYLKSFNFQSLGSTSSIATAVNSKIIKAIPFVIPEAGELQQFNEVALPAFAAIKANQAENRSLSELRDSLLPKLMSGELDVSNIDL